MTLLQANSYQIITNLPKHHVNKIVHESRRKSKVVRKVAVGRAKPINLLIAA